MRVLRDVVIMMIIWCCSPYICCMRWYYMGWPASCECFNVARKACARDSQGVLMFSVVYILSLYMGFRPHGWPPYPCLCSVLFFPELLNFFFSFGLRHIDIVAQGVGALYVYMRRMSQVCGYCVMLLLWWLFDVVHHIYLHVLRNG